MPGILPTLSHLFFARKARHYPHFTDEEIETFSVSLLNIFQLVHLYLQSQFRTQIYQVPGPKFSMVTVPYGLWVNMIGSGTWFLAIWLSLVKHDQFARLNVLFMADLHLLVASWIWHQEVPFDW